MTCDRFYPRTDHKNELHTTWRTLIPTSHRMHCHSDSGQPRKRHVRLNWLSQARPIESGIFMRGLHPQRTRFQPVRPAGGHGVTAELAHLGAAWRHRCWTLSGVQLLKITSGPHPHDPGPAWFIFFGPASPSGLRRADGRFEKARSAIVASVPTRVNQGFKPFSYCLTHPRDSFSH